MRSIFFVYPIMAAVAAAGFGFLLVVTSPAPTENLGFFIFCMSLIGFLLGLITSVISWLCGRLRR